MRDLNQPIINRPRQAVFLSIPQSPLCYWLRERFFELLAGKTLGDIAEVCQGLATANDARFVRFVWETATKEWYLPQDKRRWLPFEKGGGYGKWFGHHWWVVDWESNGARIKATHGPRVQNEKHYFEQGLTYSYMASGSLGVRYVEGGTITCDLSAGIFSQQRIVLGLAAILNTRLTSFIARAISAKIQLRESYVSRIPIPEHIPNLLLSLESSCISLKRRLIAHDPTERTHQIITSTKADSLRSLANMEICSMGVVAATLHSLEGFSEQEVFGAYRIGSDDIQSILDETGTPAGWLPLIAGYDILPVFPEGLSGISTECFEFLKNHDHCILLAEKLAKLKCSMKVLYEAGPGANIKREKEAKIKDNNEDESQNMDSFSAGAHIPIPPETFLEELSQKLQIHPISVYWLLKEGIEKEGWRCLPEEQRITADRFTVIILQLLGHRWLKQIEAGEPVPYWADLDGIIPLIEGTTKPTLLDHARERIALEFEGGDLSSIEREFAEIMGKPLDQWLETEFFKHHTKQFKKRPIAWQIQSSSFTKRRKPAFACLLYYHKIDGDILPKIRNQYIGPLRQRFETELRGIETIPLDARSDRQEKRRLELQDLILELKDFDLKLQKSSTEGFACKKLIDIIKKEPLDKWGSIDGIKNPPANQDDLLLQEQSYIPDSNDGVRVNIAPLQKAGLLASDVLAKKDIDKAIEDRAEWRADERRWCREEKLPQPGWWMVKD